MQAKLYPWQESDYNYLLQLTRRLPHAVLLHGPDGLGSLDLARSWAKSLLCGQPLANGSYCGQCSSCLLLEDDGHPDFYPLVITDEDKKSIGVMEIRAVVDFISLSSHLGKHKIILIEDTNLLNLNSANALLKILEEPAPTTLFILLSNNINHILPTILSRCHKYKLSLPSTESVVDFVATRQIVNAEFWLKYHNNCPLFETEIDEGQLQRILNALATPSVENIFTLSSEFDGKTVGFAFVLEFLSKWISDLLQYKMSGKYSYFDLYHEKVQPLIGKLQIEKAFYLHDKLNFLTKWSNHPLNYKLQIENLLLQYQQVFVK